ncbi:hypothetical protein BH11PLA2_BH11PLA2_35790 [soil metagenome]
MTKSSEPEADREIIISRVFDYPRELVWKAWTQPEHVCQWWGPNGFTTTLHVHDFRVGGMWHHTMHGPDGVDYPNKVIFTDIVPLERVAYKIAGGREDGPGIHFVATWTFETVDGTKTRLTGRMLFDTVAERDLVVREYKAVEGGKQTLAKLDAYLTEVLPREFVTTRLFHATRKQLFNAFADPKVLAAWWGPQGFTSTIEQFDFKPGGQWKFVMHGPDGSDYPNHCEFDEVDDAKRIVFCHLQPMHSFRMTMLFTDEVGQTRLTWRMLFDTAEEAERLRAFIPAANEQNFDRLAAVV